MNLLKILGSILKGFFREPKVSKSWVLDSGYNRENALIDWRQRYESACTSVVNDPEMLPSDVDGDGDDDTKCNWGAHAICKKMGYLEFEGLRANAIYSLVRSEWVKDTPERCVQAILDGGLAIAAQQGSPGHVAMIFPASLVYSGGWKEDAPMCASVGRENHIVGANYAFSKKPEYFWRAGDL